MDNAVVNIARELKLPGETAHRRIEYALCDIELMGRKISLKSPIVAELDFCFDGTAVTVSGKLSAVFAESCARCNEEFSLDFEADICERFVCSSDKSCVIDYDDESDSYTFSGFELDLSGLFNEQILLQYPPYSLCGEDCKGLCTVCGANLNHEKCKCKTDE